MACLNGQEISRPPAMPFGRKRMMSSMSSARIASPSPPGAAMVVAADSDADLGLTQQLGQQRR